MIKFLNSIGSFIKFACCIHLFDKQRIRNKKFAHLVKATNSEGVHFRDFVIKKSQNILLLCFLSHVLVLTIFVNFF